MIGRLLSWAAAVCTVLGVGAMLLMMLHVVADVVMRFAVNRPLAGTIEIVSYYYMVGIVFLAIPIAQHRNEHIIVELFTGAMKERSLRWLDSTVLLISAGYLGFFAWLATTEAIRRTQRGQLVEAGLYVLPVWQTRWFVVIGIGLTAIICLYQAVRRMRGFVEEQGGH